ncbi:EF-hand domain-containing protein [Spirillospora sp. NPDC047279]|uniref:EF-hand domain-containing protein n=1 Tax=Spirillospora sp. NPDC047279 TaxID=3155478 RepID=UPI0033D23CFC
MGKHENPNTDHMAEFRSLDVDGSGYLSRDELIAAFAAAGDPRSIAEIDAYIATADKNDDGGISYREFLSDN